MEDKFRKILESGPVGASVPCRIDMGGTLDIRTFNFPLRHLLPCTFNIALDLRTRVRLLPHPGRMVRVTSRGFKSAEYHLREAPFDRPLGLIFAVAAYFGVAGVHIAIESASPPRGALGGSSAAAVALVAAFSRLMQLAQGRRPLTRRQAALLAFAVEEGVAGVPCGIQDQLAAAYGGANAWYWGAGAERPAFSKKVVFAKPDFKILQRHMLVAYCGIAHVSRNVNGKWVKQFLGGRYRSEWAEIVLCARRFIEALLTRNFKAAARLMNRETDIRRQMTPEVLDGLGEKLFAAAGAHECGARFTGAGAGGCLWALGEAENIEKLRPVWQKLLSSRRQARLLEAGIDFRGLVVQ